MIYVTFTGIKAALAKKGYTFYTNGDYNLNLIGIRDSRKATNKFDDILCCLYKKRGSWNMDVWPCSTDPGTYWLKHGLAKGTAVLVPGQYKGAYCIGKHRGAYDALVQAEPVTVWRDSNGDATLDYEHPETGIFGINIHRANAAMRSQIVEKWSAGCQVLADPDDFAKLMALAKKSAAIYGNCFTYTLLERKDVE